ncbi:uncharacterized protein LOC129345739 [Eublepharis macularius]|uniref:Sperm equatorial segment protein 1 n=1 Tax=Eublepharis macularius TaxID=481883 RepID=A0AA97LLY8_EUBMA|nr:uncharacterized protein LOC129345739 [Eublepharis macularius]
MGRRRRRLLLLLWALLGFLHPGAPARSVQHTYENVKLMQISVHPTATVQISSNEEESPKDQKSADAKEEEKTLDDLVGVLQDMVKDIPTLEPQVPQPTEPPVVITPVIEPSQSEAVETVWVSLKPTPREEQAETSETVISADQISPASTTALWEVQDSTSESVSLHTTEATETTTGKPLVSLSLFIEKATTKKTVKDFDQLTNGALSNLEQSLENVQKLNGILDTFTEKPAGQQSEGGKEHKRKPTAEDILDLIEELIETLKSTPSYVKEDRNLYKYIQTAEIYIKQALELTVEAEKKLQEENHFLPSTPPPAQEEKTAPMPLPEPLPVPTVIVQSISPPLEPLTKKVEDVQVKMGKLKAFINLLYGFSPQLTTYTHNTAHKKVAEDIVERALAVLDAIRSVFCGSKEAQSKGALKQLLKEDMELVNQAMKAKRVS